MSLYSVQLKVASDVETVDRMKDDLSATLCDGYEPMPDPTSLPIDEIRITSMEQLITYLGNTDPIKTKRILIDLRGFEQTYSRLMIYLSPVLYRWEGDELCVIIGKDQDASKLLPGMADLLRSLELRSKGIRIISCPTCARCRTDFPAMVRSIEEKLERIDKPLDVAVMGCEVNGPGEAKAADVGIAFGDQKGMLFKNGEKVRVVTIEEAADVLLNAIDEM